MSQTNEMHTTLTGKPLNYEHDHFAGLAMGDGQGFSGDNAAGANVLPHGYTDRSLVRIPIKMFDLQDEPVKIKNPGFFKKLSNALSDKPNPTEEIKIVMMSRGDYLNYWAKGEDGRFLPDVLEPPGGRREWVRKQLELNEEWKKENPNLGAGSGLSKFMAL